MMEISWTDRVRNKEVLHQVKAERNILYTIKRKEGNWIGHILRGNCLQKLAIVGKILGLLDVEEDVSSYWMALRKVEGTAS